VLEEHLALARVERRQRRDHLLEREPVLPAFAFGRGLDPIEDPGVGAFVAPLDAVEPPRLPDGDP
jgi:hypothetical protein